MRGTVRGGTHGVVRCSMVCTMWYVTVQCGMLRYSMMCMVPYAMVQLVLHGTVWYSMVWYSIVQYCMVQCGMVWFGVARYILVWCYVVRYGTNNNNNKRPLTPTHGTGGIIILVPGSGMSIIPTVLEK